VPGIMDPKYLAVEFCVFHNAISYIIWALTHKVSHRAVFFRSLISISAMSRVPQSLDWINHRGTDRRIHAEDNSDENRHPE